MPRRKGYGIPPTKRIKFATKDYNNYCGSEHIEDEVESSVQEQVSDSSKENHDESKSTSSSLPSSTRLLDNNNYCSPSSSSSYNKTIYLHKKFKKMAMATTEEQEFDDPKQQVHQQDQPNIITNNKLPSVSPQPQNLHQPSCDATDSNTSSVARDLLVTSLDLQQSPKTSANSPITPAAVADIIDGRLLTSRTTVVLKSPTNSKSVFSTVAASSISANFSENVVVASKYICPYCKLVCNKPSVLQKHIRAHTNERPFPCQPCGFAFKTRSNLYKHCRSRSHAFKVESGVVVGDGKINHTAQEELPPECSDDEEDLNMTSSAQTQITQNDVILATPKSIYKPKFHKAKSYLLNNHSPPSSTTLNKFGLQLKIPTTNSSSPPGTPSPFTSGSSPSPEFLHHHISKLICENQAIVETTDPLWSKRYHQQQKSKENSPSALSGDSSSLSEKITAAKFINPNMDKYTASKLKIGNATAIGNATTVGDSDVTIRSSTTIGGSATPMVSSATTIGDSATTISPLAYGGKLIGLMTSVVENDVQPLNLSKPKTTDISSGGRKRFNSDTIFNYDTAPATRIISTTAADRTLKDAGNVVVDSSNLIPVKTDLAGGHYVEFLLKVRSPPMKDNQKFSKTIGHTCSLCDDNFENYEKLKSHILYECKGRNKELESSNFRHNATATAAWSYAGSPAVQKIPPGSDKIIRREYLLNPSQPSPPGPRLGLTPLVESYQQPNNKTKTDSKFVNKSDSKPVTTLKSLEELSKSPMKKNLSQFSGGKVVTFTKSGFPPVSGGGGMVLQILKNDQPVEPKIYPLKGSFTTITSNNSSPSIIKSSPFSVTHLNKRMIGGRVNGATGGIVTIIHDTKTIPYVPGIPGPQSVVSDSLAEMEQKPAPVELSLIERKSDNLVINGISKMDDGAIILTTNPVPDSIDSTAVPRLLISHKRGNAPDDEIDKCSEETTTSGGNNKFVRPTFLPLKPGTYTPKGTRNPVTSILPLVSPETPRTAKGFGQYLKGGNAYTYLGMKCSTRTYYCTLHKSQPWYVLMGPQHSKMSMYCNWKTFEKERTVLCYDSSQRHDSKRRVCTYTVAYGKTKDAITHSSYWLRRNGNNRTSPENDDEKSEQMDYENSFEDSSNELKICAGGIESLDEYTYIRGRGRGKYVCLECGIRCKKPSMLKKHIRTHTDVRPYTCRHCTFSFKTKGNLTKHMKSKAHYKKCMQLGIIPVPTSIDDSCINQAALFKQMEQQQKSGELINRDDCCDDEDGADEEEEEEEDDDEDDDGDVDEDEDEEFDERTIDDAKCQREREAVSSLLSLSKMTHQSVAEQYANAGLVSLVSRPLTYPYSFCASTTAGLSSSTPHTPTLSSISEEKEREKVSNNTVLARQFQPPLELRQTTKDRNDASRYYFGIASGMSDIKTTLSPNADLVAIPDAVESSTAIDFSKEVEKKIVYGNSINGDIPIRHVITPVSEILTPVSEPLLLATICSTTERLMMVSSSGNDPILGPAVIEQQGIMLQTYLKERAVQDVRIKQQQQQQYQSINEADFNVKYNIYNNAFQSSRISKNNSPEFPAPVSSAAAGSLKNISPEVDTTDYKSGGEACSDLCSDDETPQQRSLQYKNDMTASANLGFQKQSSTADTDYIGGNCINNFVPSNKIGGGISATPPAKRLKAEFKPPSSEPSPKYTSVTEDGRSKCVVCNKVFSKPSQLRLHVNIHYFEQPFRCDHCAVSFRTKGHLHKHFGSNSHLNKVNMNSGSGVLSSSNPRPFKCDDCSVGFRIHGHLAKHLRSKMHIMKLECLGKLPFGTYAEMERCGINMNDIDTTDCENSLESLQKIAKGVIGSSSLSEETTSDGVHHLAISETPQ